MPVHVYLDNCLVSGEVRGDLAQPAEAVALARLRDLEGKGLIDLFTSRLSWVEQDRTRDPLVRATLQSARDKTQVVPVDARLLGFNTQDLGHRGFISAPILTSVLNPTLYANLRGLGLREFDANHLIHAHLNGCLWFLTTDPDFLVIAGQLQQLCVGIQVTLPSAFAAALTS